MIRLIVVNLLAMLVGVGLVVSLEDTRLDRVLRSKKLVVCTTGDYAPYAHLRRDGHYEGADVALVENLAASLDARVEWVKTTWANLTRDFLDKECDIAAGGISATLERQRKVWMSEPLAVDSKIPLVRCDDKEKYSTVEQLNQPTVRLIAPLGGTNEAFAHKNLPRAALRVTRDNDAIFQDIVDEKYDVMITDTSEALLQQTRHPQQLCALNPQKPLQYIEKAYLLPRGDIIWKSSLLKRGKCIRNLKLTSYLRPEESFMLIEMYNNRRMQATREIPLLAGRLIWENLGENGATGAAAKKQSRIMEREAMITDSQVFHRSMRVVEAKEHLQKWHGELNNCELWPYVCTPAQCYFHHIHGTRVAYLDGEILGFHGTGIL